VLLHSVTEERSKNARLRFTASFGDSSAARVGPKRIEELPALFLHSSRLPPDRVKVKHGLLFLVFPVANACGERWAPGYRPVYRAPTAGRISPASSRGVLLPAFNLTAALLLSSAAVPQFVAATWKEPRAAHGYSYSLRNLVNIRLRTLIDA
jgi:hypothetical protein